MAINIPIITEFADQGLKSAQGAFSTFRSKVAEAEGGMGKFKAGANVAFDSVKANAGKLAAVGGAAIAGFALKAIGDFKDLALAVDDFRNKTDLTLDQSSKWVSYTGDLGIEADAMTKIFSRLAKAATDEIPAFEELGVAIAFGPDGSTDIEETFLRVNDAINSLDDPVAEAAYRADLFGKGWMSAAELVQMGSDDIRIALDGVKDFEVIDEEEIEKAKDLRQAQDELGDAMARLSVKLGEALIPALTAFLDAATPLLEIIGKIDADVAASAASDGAIVNYAKVWDDLNDGPIKFLTGGAGLALVAEGVRDVDDAVNDNQLSVEDLHDAWKDGSRAMIDAHDSADELTDALISVDDALADLKGEVDERQAWRNLQDEFDRTMDAAIEAFTEGTPKAIRDSERALDNLRLEVGEYIAEVDGIPVEKKTDFIATLDDANIDQIDSILNELARNRTSYIEVITTAREEAGTGSGMGSGRPATEPLFPPGSTITVPGIGNVRIPGRPSDTSISMPNPSYNIPSIGRYSAGVTVNVAGSVISENDLVETVRKGLVNAQRNGAGLVYTNR